MQKSVNQVSFTFTIQVVHKCCKWAKSFLEIASLKVEIVKPCHQNPYTLVCQQKADVAVIIHKCEAQEFFPISIKL